MNPIIKVLPQIVAVSALMAAIGLLGVLGHLTPVQVNSILLALLGAVGIHGALILGSSAPNSDTFPHLVLGVFFLGLVVALATKNVLSNNDVFGFITALTGGSLIAAGSVLNVGTVPKAPQEVPSAGTTETLP